MKEEFEKLVPIYGISRKEAEMLEVEFGSIENLKIAVFNDTVKSLNKKDIERLKKYFSTSSLRLCAVCRHTLPLILDRGICPICKHRTGL